jgi:hypothetical protein
MKILIKIEKKVRRGRSSVEEKLYFLFESQKEH